MGKGGGSSSSVSSIDSSTYPCHSLPNSTKDLSTDLRLGLSISYSHNDFSSTTSTSSRNDWPPIKPFLRSTLAGNADQKNRRQQSLFIKVYMEGIPIGRKLDLFAHHGYDDLVSTLSLMFNTNILCADVDRVSSKEYQVLTYEDKEGDWMMVGDVPWEMFVATVKRLKITRADRC